MDRRPADGDNGARAEGTPAGTSSPAQAAQTWPGIAASKWRFKVSAAAAGTLARPAVRASRTGWAARTLGSFFMVGVMGTAAAGEGVMRETGKKTDGEFKTGLTDPNGAAARRGLTGSTAFTWAKDADGRDSATATVKNLCTGSF